MYYPWLDVPVLTAPMVVAIVAIIHVFVSHYAVGGGILAALENGRALRDGDVEYRAYWKKHAKFFVLTTVVFGAITGVGIWWTIGLASPLATESLIRIFAFGWAIEWCFFILELAAGFAFYYFWDKLSPRAHSFAGWIYALSAWISLVLITGITAFMLNSQGVLNDWERTGSFWDAFLNRQFLPQTVARTGCALTMGSFYVLLHAAIFERNLDVREKVTKRMRIPAFWGIFLLAAGVAGWALCLPESALATMERAAATNIFAGLFVAIIAGITLILIVGPVMKPRETSPALALALFLMGIAGIGVGEFVREAVRKPFVVDRLVYGSQIYRTDVAKLRQNGLLYEGVWTRALLDSVQEKYPNLKISAEKYLGRTPDKPKYWALLEEWEKANPAPAVDESGSTAPTDAPDGTANPATPGDSEETTEPAAPTAPNNASANVATTEFIGETAAKSRGARVGGTLSTDFPDVETPKRAAASRFAPISTPTAASVPTANEQPSVAPVAESVAAPVSAPVAEPIDATLPEPVAAPQTPVNAAPVASTNAARPEPSVAPVARNESRPAETLATPVAEPADSSEPAVPAESADSSEPAETAEALDLRLNGPIARGNEDLLKLDPEDRLTLGRAVFLHHCNDCHATKRGYSAVAPLIAGESRDELKALATSLNRSRFFMPPWAGTEVEAELLAEYLESIEPEIPANLRRASVDRAEKDAADAKSADATTADAESVGATTADAESVEAPTADAELAE